MPDFHVQRLDPDDGFYRDLPGGGHFSDSVHAKHAAMSYHETTNERVRVVNCMDCGKTIFDSKYHMPGHFDPE